MKHKMTNTRGYTYLVANGAHYKIGITTKTPQSRIAELQTGSPTKIEISGYCYNKNALEMEQLLHKKFANKRLEGEWFALNDDDVAIIHHHFETNYNDEYFAPLSEKGTKVQKNKAIQLIKNEKLFETLSSELAELTVSIDSYSCNSFNKNYIDYKILKEKENLMSQVEYIKYNEDSEIYYDALVNEIKQLKTKIEEVKIKLDTEKKIYNNKNKRNTVLIIILIAVIIMILKK